MLTKRLVPILLGLLVCRAGIAGGATVLYCPFDSLESWTVRSLGATRASVIEKSESAHCLELVSRGGTVLVTRDLPVEAMRGRRVTVSCLARADDVSAGPQASSRAKLHLAAQTPRGVAHFQARLEGTSQWHRESLTADVPSDASRVVLNLGLEACTGRAAFDQLVVRNDLRGVYPLMLTSVANAGHEQLNLGVFPEGAIEFEGIPFHLLDPAEHDGDDCFRLRGLGHEDWPKSTASPIPVGTGASTVYLLHGALEGRPKSDTPCAIWNAHFAGSPSFGLSVFEGRQIGAIGQTEDLENWHIAWRKQDPAGNWVTFGVTRWTIYSESPVLAISCEAYRGAAPVVLAVTVVEEPPRPEPEPEAFDESGEMPDPWDINE